MKSILFIEDEPRQTESFREELELSGYQVRLERTVDGALAFLKENSGGMDLIVLDIMMSPGEALKGEDTKLGLQSGVHLYERIRQLNPDVRIAVFTNVTDQYVKDFFKRNGVIYLHKRSFEPDDLVRKIEEILGSGE